MKPIILHTIQELQEYRAKLQEDLGFVPTMGALHQGHLSLLQKSKSQNKHTLLSIFVNPTQFGANEDFGKYPRTFEADCALATQLGIDAIFAPEITEMYPSQDPITLNAPKQMGYVFEGFHRIGHFDGVLQIVLKLLNLTRPTRAYFGQKDAQQLLLIQQLVKDFFLPTQIIPCPIVRDSDGLALSSRNIYLSTQERQKALVIPQTLEFIKECIQGGEKDCEVLKNKALSKLQDLQVEYLAFCDHSLNEIAEIMPTQTLILLTCKVGTTRLLDNLWI